MVTYEQARSMIKQAFIDLMAQGQFGYDPKTYSSRYLTSEGNSCVIGLLIKRNYPEVPLGDLPNHPTRELLDDGILGKWEPAARRLAVEAQLCHDRAISFPAQTLQGLLHNASPDILDILLELRA